MVYPQIIRIVKPMMKKINVGEDQNNRNRGERELSAAETACVWFGILNIALASCVVGLCLVVLTSDTIVFAKWMIPWHNWDKLEYGHEEHEPAAWHNRTDILLAYILKVLGPFIVISKALIFLGMSVALICGVLRRSASTVKAFIIYSAVVLPMCLAVNMMYLVCMGLYGVYDTALIYPHFAVLLFNLMFAFEVLLAVTAHRNMKSVAPFDPTRLPEFETL